MIYNTLHRKLKIAELDSHYKSGVNSGVPKGYAVPARRVAPVQGEGKGFDKRLKKYPATFRKIKKHDITRSGIGSLSPVHLPLTDIVVMSVKPQSYTRLYINIC